MMDPVSTLNDRTFSSTHFPNFNQFDHHYFTCGGTVHVIEGAKWVNFGQASVALVEIVLFISFYLVDWLEPTMNEAFDTKFLVFGICLFAANVFFTCILYAGIKHENFCMIIADLGWMTVSAALRFLSIFLLIMQITESPKNACWLSMALTATLASLGIQCLSCYVLAKCAYYMKDVNRNRRKMETIAAARMIMVQYFRPATRVAAPPSYEVATLNVTQTARNVNEEHRAEASGQAQRESNQK